ETLGFHETVGENELAASHTDTSVENPLEFSEEKPSYVSQSKTSGGREFTSFFSTIIRIIKPLFHSMKRVARRLPVGVIGIGIVLIILIGVGFWGVTQYLPRVTVTLEVLPKDISRQDSVIIDPQGATIDTEKKVIPGKKLEKVVSGEKNIPTTGKKKIGDPAKGTVTIFNKSEGTAYSLKKGTIISTGTLQFVLDNDVSLASASTNLSQGQTVFGKTTTTATASTVGAEGNIEANREFTLKDYQSSVLVARNDQPFTGGTSKEVTVVSRADYDNLLKSLTTDLIEKAKAELSQSVSGKDRMIDQTVKTAVKEKQYVEEVDQEAKELHGSLTVSVSAYTYNEDDVASLLSAVAQADIPAGYVVNPGRTTVTIGDVTVGKDGKMTAKATLISSAIPAIDSSSIKKTIAGKKLVDVEKELKNIPGVASAEFVFKSAWKKDTLPISADNISITVSPVE
ncbi:baseplate J/gp47 family protein, partial [Patescibacteria group bacterium]|nr:baseplate J/gp47 family protein [Patescibacteria group bacterium]